ESHQQLIQQQLQQQHQQQSLASAGRLFDRLFAHHNVLSGELVHLEGRRGGMEESANLLNKSAADLTTLTDSTAPATCDLLSANLAACKEACGAALNKCAEISDRERRFLAALPTEAPAPSTTAPIPAVLREGRAQREAVWREYMEEVRNKAARVDEDFSKEVARLEAEYAELEAKLAT
ncbi:hypothetical protein BOX15_Mlig016518g2, partial [Macrostomum lignano]